jgi:hypothetical protein
VFGKWAFVRESLTDILALHSKFFTLNKASI